MTLNFPIRSFAWVLLFTVAAAAVGAPGPDEKEPRRLEVVEGIIKAVDPANNTFILTPLGEKKTDPASEVKLTVDQKTNYWLDGKPSTMNNAMKAGNSAVVTHMNGLALKVHVKSAPA
ncbi:MAG: hypothetical protein H7210_11305 [Pyrinomonadaceae bacterium]|nr:hypothetical protein [Phycisphaerales bacterium]